MNLYYFCIIFILVLNSYISRIFGEVLGNEVLQEIERLNTVLLLICTGVLFFLKEKFSNFYLKKVGLLSIMTVFLRVLYISFFVVIISNFVSKNKRLKYLLFILSFFYIFILLLNIFGLLEFNNTKSVIREFINFTVYRRTLGFNHPNAAMSLLLPIFSLLYYLYYDKYKKAVVILILVIGKIMFDLTYSRTTFILIILLVLLIFIKDKYIKKFKKLFLMTGNIMIFLTIYLPLYFKESILNKYLSGRLRLFNYYLTNYNVSFLGDKEIIKSYSQYILDNTYLRILLENGILGILLLMILIYSMMRMLFKNKDYKAIRIFFIILIFGFMESSALFYYFNIIYFIIGDYFFKKYI